MTSTDLPEREAAMATHPTPALDTPRCRRTADAGPARQRRGRRRRGARLPQARGRARAGACQGALGAGRRVRGAAHAGPRARALRPRRRTRSGPDRGAVPVRRCCASRRATWRVPNRSGSRSTSCPPSTRSASSSRACWRWWRTASTRRSRRSAARWPTRVSTRRCARDMEMTVANIEAAVAAGAPASVGGGRPGERQPSCPIESQLALSAYRSGGSGSRH